MRELKKKKQKINSKTDYESANLSCLYGFNGGLVVHKCVVVSVKLEFWIGLIFFCSLFRFLSSFRGLLSWFLGAELLVIPITYSVLISTIRARDRMWWTLIFDFTFNYFNQPKWPKIFFSLLRLILMRDLVFRLIGMEIITSTEKMIKVWNSIVDNMSWTEKKLPIAWLNWKLFVFNQSCDK